MKKVIVMFFLFSLTFVLTAQIFKPVSAFPDPKLLRAGETLVDHKWEWRFDATMVIAEVNRNTVTKQWTQTSFSAVGPAIGIQKFVPASDLDPTPVNTYGASLGLAIGKTVYDPQLAEAKIVLAVNLWEYFKFGTTYTFNPPADIAKLGIFFGGGITF